MNIVYVQYVLIVVLVVNGIINCKGNFMIMLFLKIYELGTNSTKYVLYIIQISVALNICIYLRYTQLCVI